MAFKIYTKTGDSGQTGLFGGKRLPKYHLRIEAYGTTDELNAHLGFVRDQLDTDKERDWLFTIQNRLFTIGAILASDPDKEMATPDLTSEDVALLEKAIDEMELQLPALKNFLLPGGHPAVSSCHIARTVCRRGERTVVALASQENIAPLILTYLNRLSDFLFVLSRKIALDFGVSEIPWKGREA